MEPVSAVIKETEEDKTSSSDAAADDSSLVKVVVKQKPHVKKPSTKQLLELEQDFIVPVDPSTVSYTTLVFSCAQLLIVAARLG